MKAQELLKSLQLDSSQRERVQKFQERLKHAKLIKIFESCPSCASKLSFQTETDWFKHEVYERFECERCFTQGPLRRYRLC